MSFLLRGAVDRFGAGGGDKTVNHNVIKDDIYIHAKRAHMAARLESCGVSRLFGLRDQSDGQRRRSDALLCSA